MSNVFHELNNLQLKIGFLFRDLLNQKDQYKLNVEELVKEIRMLNNEIISLKKQNLVLKQKNDNLRNFLMLQLKPFLKENVSNKGTGRLIFETLQTIIDEQLLLSNDELQNVVVTPKRKFELENVEGKTKEYSQRLNQEEFIKKESESISELHFTTQFLIENEDQQISEIKSVSDRYNSECMLEKILERKSHCIVSEKENTSLTCEPNVHNSVSLSPSQNTVKNEKETLIEITDMCTPETLLNDRKSPVFKDLRNKKQDYLTEIENNQSKSTFLKLVDENFLLRNANLTVSPLKRTLDETKSPSPKKETFTSKRFKRECLDRNSSQLKKSNSRNVEIAKFGGLQKLTQTLLNIDYFRKKEIEELKSKSREIEQTIILNEAENLFEGEDDDFITESPKKSNQSLEDIVKQKHSLTQDDFLTASGASVSHCDETYISSSILRNNNILNEDDELKKIDENQTPLKRPFPDKIPQHKILHYDNKREFGRRKEERKRLPGHTCAECNQVMIDLYYKDVFGDSNNENLKEILNKCSRHRKITSPSAEDTPPGYWKPYLTATISPTYDFIADKRQQ